MRAFGMFVCLFGMGINIFACYHNVLDGDQAGAWLHTLLTAVCAVCFVVCAQSD